MSKEDGLAELHCRFVNDDVLVSLLHCCCFRLVISKTFEAIASVVTGAFTVRARVEFGLAIASVAGGRVFFAFAFVVWAVRIAFAFVTVVA